MESEKAGRADTFLKVAPRWAGLATPLFISLPFARLSDDVGVVIPTDPQGET